MKKIIAVSENGEGLLKMKESKEKEEYKSVERKNIEVCNFVKNAFCSDGDVKMVEGDFTPKIKVWFESEDKRGKFFVAFGNLE